MTENRKESVVDTEDYGRTCDFYKCKLYHLDIIIIVSPAYCGAAIE